MIIREAKRLSKSSRRRESMLDLLMNKSRRPKKRLMPMMPRPRRLRRRLRAAA
jgi:hypothetical protein